MSVDCSTVLPDADRVAPAPAAIAAAMTAARRVAEAPDPHSARLRSLIADRHRISADCVQVGPGSAGLIHGLIARAAAAGPGRNAVMSHPTFAAYRLLCQRYGIEPRTVALREYQHDLDGIADQVDHRTCLVLVDSPHGVTGTVCGFGPVAQLSTTLPGDGLVLYDNAYGEFDPASDLDEIAARATLPGSRIVVSKTFSKAHALFGARVGYLLGAGDRLATHGPLVQKYDVSSIGQVMAEAAYQDATWTARNVAVVAWTRTGIYEVCRRHAVPFVQSRSNSVLIAPTRQAGEVARRLRALACTVTDDTSHGIQDHLQILATRRDVVDDLATSLQPATTPSGGALPMNVHPPTTVQMFVVFTGGTVDALRHFVPPLLAHTPWALRLVSNGCTPAERETLAEVAATSPRLTTQDVGADTIVPLGEVLSDLLSEQIPGADHVGFLDSDILFTADVTDGFAQALEAHDAVFSAPPIWLDPAQSTLNAERTEVSGPYRVTADGLVLGSSYLAIYRQDALRAVMAGCAVTADKYLDTASLAPAFQQFLDDHGLTGKVFDPTKLLNLAFTVQGRPVTFHEPGSILHIGGYSHTAFRRTLADHPEDVPATHRRHDDILGYRDNRPYMPLKRAVTERLSTSYAQLAGGQALTPETRFPDELERRVRLVESHWQHCLHDGGGHTA